MIIKKTNVAVLIRNKEDKFLLIKRCDKDDSKAGFWELPSGGVDTGEDVINATRRETKEETGISLKGIRLILVDKENYSFRTSKGYIKQVSEHTFLANLQPASKVVLSKEHIDFRWIGLKELDDVYDDKDDLIYKRIKRIFKKI